MGGEHMKSEKNILFAFLLNFAFSVFEFVGGIFTGSVAILSDSVHDMGDAVSIGIAFFLEKKSKKQPDERYTYGYAGYSVIGSVITTLILLAGSVAVIYSAVERIITPTPIDYNGMMVFAIVGVCVNLGAAFLTRRGDSLNQKAVNLHMLEGVLGWIVVLIGAVVMKFTDFYLIDPLMSIGVSLFILLHAIRYLKDAFSLFLERTPQGIEICELREHLCAIEGILDVHHIHVWSIDGTRSYATMHIVSRSDPHETKERVREELKEHGIAHATLEIESEGEACHEKCCHTEAVSATHHHHHHHHHH